MYYKFQIGDKVVLNFNHRKNLDTDWNGYNKIGIIINIQIKDRYSFPYMVEWGFNDSATYSERELAHYKNAIEKLNDIL